MTLYELKEEYLKILQLIEDPDADPELIAGTLECIDYDIEDKLDGYAAVLSELNSDMEKIAAEIKRLTERKKQIEKRADAMKERIKEAMIAIGKKKIVTPLHAFSVCKNGGKAPLILKEGIEAGDVWPEHVKTTYDIDKEAIRKYLEGGGECSYARLGERKESLRIK